MPSPRFVHAGTFHSLLLALATLAPAPLLAASAVVGTGTPASCTEAAFDAGITAVNSGGGTLSFDCGPEPHLILVTAQRALAGPIVMDGGGRITLWGGLALIVSQPLRLAVMGTEGWLAFARWATGLIVVRDCVRVAQFGSS